MPWDKFHLFTEIIAFIFPTLIKLLRQKLSAVVHKRTYKLLPASEIKNVVVIGGSFAGVQITQRLAQTLPSGYRVILVEKNSHLNYLFVFPRFSVVGGQEKYAFIPYEGIAKSGPEGIYEHKQATATSVSPSHIELDSGEKIQYEYLVLATGTSSAPPSKLGSTERKGAINELIVTQQKLASANSIAIVGGGAVGVELASDIKSFNPEKNVTLFHSRAQLMPSFGQRLHDHTMKALGDLGVRVQLNERPVLPKDGKRLVLNDGSSEEFDLVIPCTGQRPNSGLLSYLSPQSISKSTSRILVKPTLQLADASFPRIFAFGDVAETGGPKMARAAHFQCDIVLGNILAQIEGTKTLKDYKPNVAFEGSIKLTLGKTNHALYMQTEKGREILVSIKSGEIDLGVRKQWWFFGANPKAVDDEDEKHKSGRQPIADKLADELNAGLSSSA